MSGLNYVVCDRIACKCFGPIHRRRSMGIKNIVEHWSRAIRCNLRFGCRFYPGYAEQRIFFELLLQRRIMHLKLTWVSSLLLAVIFKSLQKCRVLEKAIKDNHSKKQALRAVKIVSKFFRK